MINKEHQLLYKKKELLIDTNLDEDQSENDYELEERNINNFRFKTYVNGIIKIKAIVSWII